MNFLIAVFLAYIVVATLAISLRANPHPQIISVETNIVRMAGFGYLPLIMLNIILTTMLVVVHP